MATGASQRVRLRWSGAGQRFDAERGSGVPAVVDGEGAEGPSPMELLLLSLAGCMGVDLVMILEKSRVPVESLEVEVEGGRAENPPRRYTSIRLSYRVRGPGPEHQTRLEHAVELSRDTYCSVLHSLRGDIPVEIDIQHI